MAVSINVRGENQPFPSSNLEDYSVVEDATPMDPNSMTGGYGQISFDILDYRDYRLLRGKEFLLDDTVKGRTSGLVTEFTNNNGLVTITTDSALGVLNSWQHMPAFVGYVDDLIEMWFAKVGLEVPIRYEGAVAAQHVTVQAFIGNLWDHLKQFLAANKIEMALVYNTIVFRHFRHFDAVTDNLIDITTGVSLGETARTVEVSYYNNEYVSYGELYPPASSYSKKREGAEEDVSELTIMQVDSNETVEYTLQLDATPIRVDRNPEMVEYVDDRPYAESVYSVVGSDDLPITPARWSAGRGWLRVNISDDDPTQLIVTLHGSSDNSLAPYRIAMSSGSGNYYNSLHIMGEGTRFREDFVTIHTGATVDTTGTEVGVRVQNRFITTKSQALDTGKHTAAAYSGFQANISGTAVDVTRRGIDVGIRATVADFNDSW